MILRESLQSGEVITSDHLQTAQEHTVDALRQACQQQDWKSIYQTFTKEGSADWALTTLTTLLVSTRWQMGSGFTSVPTDVSEPLAAFVTQTFAVNLDGLSPQARKIRLLAGGPSIAVQDSTEAHFLVLKTLMQHQQSDPHPKEISALIDKIPEEQRMHFVAVMASVLLNSEQPIDSDIRRLFTERGQLSLENTSDQFANGIYRTSEGRDIPLRFRYEDGKWKIDAILTPTGSYHTIRKHAWFLAVAEDIPAGTELQFAGAEQPLQWFNKLEWLDSTPKDAVLADIGLTGEQPEGWKTIAQLPPLAGHKTRRDVKKGQLLLLSNLEPVTQGAESPPQ